MPLPLAVRLSFFYGAFFWVIGIRLPFWPVWLDSRGMSAAEIGALVGVASWVTIVAAPTVARWIDRRGDRRTPILVLSATVCAGFLLFFPAHGFWAIFAAAVFVSAAMAPILPAADSMTLLEAKAGRVDYGRIRLWGSITFIAASLAGGAILHDAHPDAVLWLMLGGMAALIAAGWLLPDTRVQPAGPKQGSALTLLRSPKLALFLAIAGCLQASHAVLYAFGSLHWRANGHSDATIGWLWSEGVIAEIVLFAYGGAVMKRFTPAQLFLIAAAGGLIRWPVLAFTAELPALVATQALHALTFGAAHLGGMSFVQKEAPPGLSATLQSLLSALGSGLALGIAMPLGGVLFEAFGPRAFLVMAAFSGAAALGALALGRMLATQSPPR
jgi:PPP family 3-phenylpropionic acid transporter